jgi:two-component system response regulator AtoC
MILPEHLPARMRAAVEQSGSATLPDVQRLAEIERQAILQGLREHQNNRTETAKALGISRRALLYKLQRYREQGFEID